MSLSVQLADARQQAAQMSAALEAARAQMQAQQAAVVVREGETGNLAKELQAAQAALRRERAGAQELRRILDALKPKAGVSRGGAEGTPRDAGGICPRIL